MYSITNLKRDSKNWKAERRNRRDQYKHAVLQFSTARYERFLPSIFAAIALTPFTIQVYV